MKKIALIFVIFLSSCIEPLDLLVTGNTELPDILIVEATISNQMAFHEVRLSKVDSLLDLETDVKYNPFVSGNPDTSELDNVPHETNAQVRVAISNGTSINFSEANPGTYVSDQEFAAQNDLEYELQITRSNGKEYMSKPMKIEGAASIENIYAEKTSFSDGGDAVSIYVDNQPISGNTSNIRFTYTETYKIIAPNWSPFKFVLSNYDPCALPVPTYSLEIVERVEEAQVCYGTDQTNRIILSDKDVYPNGALTNFAVHIVSKENFKISHRYSIEVQQQVTSAESFGFYEKLKNFSQSQNIFSLVQPGALEGNISSLDGQAGSVIGFFDVVSVSTKRLFFNFEDFFPDEALPDYPIRCVLHSSTETHQSYCSPSYSSGGCPASIIERMALDNITYVDINAANIGTCPGPYTYVSKPCGDCRTLGSNVVPDYWVE